MRIVVFGASSGIGRELVLQARTGGHHAVAVARSIGSEAAASLTLVRGSVLDPGVAERAVAGADAVAWCVGVRTLGPAFLRKVTVFSEGTRRAIEAMQESGVAGWPLSPGSVPARAEDMAVSCTNGSGYLSSSGAFTPTRIGRRLS